jgi:hypothetical protein
MNCQADRQAQAGCAADVWTCATRKDIAHRNSRSQCVGTPPDVSGQSLRRNTIVSHGPSALVLPVQAWHCSLPPAQRVFRSCCRATPGATCAIISAGIDQGAAPDNPRLTAFIHVRLLRTARQPGKRRRLTLDDLSRAGGCCLSPLLRPLAITPRRMRQAPCAAAPLSAWSRNRRSRQDGVARFRNSLSPTTKRDSRHFGPESVYI